MLTTKKKVQLYHEKNYHAFPLGYNVSMSKMRSWAKNAVTETVLSQRAKGSPKRST